jgi:soluble lytic murein transglycosylase
MADNPGVKRALALLRVDMRVEGVREWNWVLRGMGDRELLAAAEVANRAGVYDRAIAAADRTERTRLQPALPVAVHEQVRPAAKTSRSTMPGSTG